MSDSDGLRNPLNLQEQCLIYIISHLEHIPPAQLALLPPHFTKTLVSRLPLLDLLRLDNSAFATTIDFQEFWSSVCAINLPQNSTEVFYLESRKWLEAFGIQRYSREFFLAFISNCALFPWYMPLGNALNLLLVRTSTNLAVSSLLQLCSGDNVQLSKELLFMHVGRDIGLSLPERYLSFILQWEAPTTLADVLLKVVNFRPRLIWVPQGVDSEHLNSMLKWSGIREFLSCVEAFHLSLSDPRMIYGRYLAETIILCSSSLHILHVVGSQARLDRFFSGFKVCRSQNAMLQSIEITSEKADGRQDEETRESALINLASLIRHNLSTLTSISLSYQCFPSTKACQSLGQSLSAVTSQPTIKEVSLHQLSLFPQNLVELIHSFLETPSSHQQKMLLSELCLVQHQMDLHPPEYEEWPCEGCKLLKSLTIISTRLSVEIISWLLQYGHVHFKELHLDNVESDSLSLLYTSPNFQCEHLVLESCVFGNPLTGFRYLLSNTSLKSLEISELIHSDFLEDITCGLKNQSGIGTLEELNLISCTMGGKGDRKIRAFFAALFDLPQLEKFTLMLQYPKLQLSDLHSMVHCWKKIKKTQRRKLKSLTIVDSCCEESVEPALQKLTQHMSFRRVRS